MCCPSVYPNSRRPCLNASTRNAMEEGEEGDTSPIRCASCASAKWADARKTMPTWKAAIFLFMVSSANDFQLLLTRLPRRDPRAPEDFLRGQLWRFRSSVPRMPRQRRERPEQRHQL